MDLGPWIRGVSCTMMALLGSPAAMADSIQVRASGRITGTCTVAGGSNFPAVSLAASGNATATATVNCNTGFVIRATSAKGAITSVSQTFTGSTNSVPYSLALTALLDSGSISGGPCGSATLVAGNAGCVLSPAGSGLSSGGRSATSKTATLTFSWSLPAQKLVVGSYSDTIALSIAAAP